MCVCVCVACLHLCVSRGVLECAWCGGACVTRHNAMYYPCVCVCARVRVLRHDAMYYPCVCVCVCVSMYGVTVHVCVLVCVCVYVFVFVCQVWLLVVLTSVTSNSSSSCILH